MHSLKDPVFKGCTRPAMLWGVPLVPLLMIGGSMLIPAIWALLASPALGVGILLLMIPVFVAMRMTTRHDDQRLAQHARRARMALRQGNRRFWGAHAYVPVRLKRRA
ncbi:VirB3 family type IV secretion system protein [Burkholderia vietnamiensis]|jgi:type IV secretion system protein VirB3|uniref:Type IV secretory pathway, VirB3 family protein n=3 Tax=Burkholderia cepacia complex TaxID=87882 RepID=A4JR13_BURVG|nr:MULTISPECIES: VirB3 family type IV secretion system protein [Burkholderia]ABO58716.1 type IV secretory pathway, VirB3 family protein [Burkholderia vietnamiensis G4]AJY08022.1 type IV secretory pathway, VirB3-like family protein [Burkholderia vietnamiensis LMG 10929]AOJ76847.1 conjugal transfer protein TraD [Burkholderia ubonensis]AOK02432.1 conjugal transfer protein TraD [Burkholderia vietnamiensis]AOK13944.1 conjugal transfer protein TraD [Burkholderia vietnamiensis]